MTPHAATVQNLQQERHGAPAPASAAPAPMPATTTMARLPEYPRVAEVLQRIGATAPATAAPAPGAPHAAVVQQSGGHGPVPAESVARAVAATVPVPAQSAPVHAASHAPVMTQARPVVAQPSHPARAYDAGRIHDDVDELDELSEEEIEELIDDLTLREVAREALRARLIAFGENRHQRSAYELVFLMLAFSVTVLITTPPLVQLALALHGNQPG